jgi:tetratricopeptide (TPR) repeat protein
MSAASTDPHVPLKERISKLENQARVLADRGDLDGALALHKEAELLCRAPGNEDGLLRALGNQANILYSRGDLDGAMRLYKESEILGRELGDKNGLLRALGSQANILYSRGDLDGAMTLYKEGERLGRELGDKDGLLRLVGNQARILQDRGDLDGTMALLKEQEHLCRELGNKDRLARVLGSQATIFRQRGDLDGAIVLHGEIERLCRELGNKMGLAQTLNNRARLLSSRGDLDGAIGLYKESERLGRELSDPQSLLISLASQAALLCDIPSLRLEASRIADEALTIATRHGYAQLVSQIQRIRDSISSSEQSGATQPPSESNTDGSRAPIRAGSSQSDENFERMKVARMDEVRTVIIAPAVIDVTMKALQKYGAHRLEGLVLWLGHVEPGRARVVQAFLPEQHPVSDESGLGYFVTGDALFELNRGLAVTGLRLIAQVHSHPKEAYHSRADDRFAIVTAEGGFSLVVPNFGKAPADPASWAVYRLVGGDWTELASEEVRNLFEVSGRP